MIWPKPYSAPNFTKKVILPKIVKKPENIVKTNKPFLQQGDWSNLTSEPVAPFGLSPIVQGSKPIISKEQAVQTVNNTPVNMPKPAQLPATGAKKLDKNVLWELSANIAQWDDLETIRQKFPEVADLKDDVLWPLTANIAKWDSYETIVKKYPELWLQAKPTVDIMKGLRNAKKGLDMWNPMFSALWLATATQWWSDVVWWFIDSFTWLPRWLAKIGVNGAEKVWLISKWQSEKAKSKIDESVSVWQNVKAPTYQGTKMAWDLIQLAAPTWVWTAVWKWVQAAMWAKSVPVIWKIAWMATEWAIWTQAQSVMDKGKLASVKDTALWALMWWSLEWVGQWLKATWKWVGNFFKNLRINEQTQNVLKSTKPQELDDYIKAAQTAKWNLEAPTTFEIAAKKTDEAIKTINEQKKNLWEQIGTIRWWLWDITAQTKKIDDSFNEALKKYWNLEVAPINESVWLWIIWPDGQEMTKQIAKWFQIKPTKWVSQLPDSEQAIIKDFYWKLQDAKKDWSIWSLINLKSYLWNNVKKVEKASSQLQAIVWDMQKSIDWIVNDVAPAQYKPLLKQYSELIDLSDDIDRFYGEWERWSTMIKSIYWSNSWRTREFMTKLKKLTGVDLYKEGALAKFVAESMWDKRGIQQFIENPQNITIQGIIWQTVKKWLDKVADPIKLAKKVIETKKKKPSSVIETIKRVTAAKTPSFINNNQ